MSGSVILLIVLGGAALLFALAWWSSGRSKKPTARMSADHEIARGMGTLQGGAHNPPGSQHHPF